MKAQHWTAEQMIAHLYGVGPEDGHLVECPACSAQIAAMRAARQSFEARRSAGEVSYEFLARQRRTIYAGLGKKRNIFTMPRWAPAVGMVAVATAGVIVIEEHRQASHPSISDAQLVEEVGQMAEDPTPSAVAPMEALFEQ